ncbi:MAG: hypothetical protein KDB00_20605 [Planctomycetales bacterium]|nr:hypothetical protein [Planctomycetales bacterium]
MRERIVGGWTASIKFDNEDFHKLREEIGEESKADELDTIVENLMGTTFQVVFNEDGTLESSQPGGDKDKRAPGSYVVEDDQNTSAVVKVAVDAPDGKQEVTLNAEFTGDDQFKSPWTHGVPEEASGLFFAEFRRDKFAE